MLAVLLLRPFLAAHLRSVIHHRDTFPLLLFLFFLHHLHSLDKTREREDDAQAKKTILSCTGTSIIRLRQRTNERASEPVPFSTLPEKKKREIVFFPSLLALNSFEAQNDPPLTLQAHEKSLIMTNRKRDYCFARSESIEQSLQSRGHLRRRLRP